MDYPLPVILYHDRWENLFPHEYKERIELPIFMVVPLEKAGSCWHCGNSTKWWDISFLSPVCSIQCYLYLNVEYLNAERKAQERDLVLNSQNADEEGQ